MNTRTRQLLDFYTDYLLVSFGQATATGLAALLPGQVSHDQITRLLNQEQFTGADLWKLVKSHLRKTQSENAVFILDDTIEEKPYSDESELICWHYDHVTDRKVKGVNMLSALYHSQDISLPVELVYKTELVTDKKTGKDRWVSPRTKNEMARQMVENAIRHQIPFRYILADVWFSSAENMLFFKQKKRKDFLLPLKSNRKVALSPEAKERGQWLPVSSLPQDTDAGGVTIYLEQVPFALLLVRHVLTNEDGSQSVLYLVSSDLALSGPQMVALYKKRWKIEEYHQSIKSHAAFAKSPTKRPRGQSNHFFASLVAFVKLEAYRVGLCLKHATLRGKLYQRALASAFQHLQQLKAACPAPATTL